MINLKNLKKQDYLVLGGGLLLVGIVGYSIYIRMRNKKEISLIRDAIEKKANFGSGKGSGGRTSEEDVKIMSQIKLTGPMHIGSKGDTVIQLQKALNEAYGCNIRVDGKFGLETFNCLCKNYWTGCKWGPSILYKTTSLGDVDPSEISEILKDKK